MSNLSKILRTETEAICYPDGRMVGSDGHEKARLHLKSRLQQIGCRPYAGRSLELPYEFKGKSFCNLAGRLPGTDRRLSPILIGAHYDSVIPFPCADDNAAAVAIALQVGDLIAGQAKLERDVVIAIFDAEEPPYFHTNAMGSNRFYEDHVLGKSEIHAAIVLDLVGHDISMPGSMLECVPGIGTLAKMVPGLAKKDIAIPMLKSLLFVTGSESHQELPGVLDAIGQPAHLKVMPTLNKYVGDMSDHGAFRRHGVPYYFLSCGQWAHYHKPTDTPDRLNYDKMAAITLYVMQILAQLDECELGGRTGKEQIHDTIELESAFIREALGILHKPVMKWVGIHDVDSRKMMDKFVNRLLSEGLC